VTASANTEQERYWNTDGGPRWVELAPFLDRQLRPFGEAAMAAAHPAPGDAALDVGCGAGATTRALAVAVAPTGSVLGLDISEPLLAEARSRHDAVAGV
jgi:ubiquinone/menaquinone biosynthesis C-methylase UbiE